MAFDFPNSPSEGTTYLPAGGPQWVYTGGVWKMLNAAQTGTAEARNRIVNGAMQISQENGNTPTAVTNFYDADQWNFGYASSTTIYSNRYGPFAGPRPYYIGMTASPVEAAASGSEYARFLTILEGLRISDFELGTIGSKQFIIAFDTSLPVAGTYWVSIGNLAGTHTWAGSYTISAGEVGTWVRKQVVVPAGAINAGVWPIDTSIGFYLSFVYHAGPSMIGVAGFQSGNFMAGPGQALGLSTAGTCYLTNVGLYLDPLATGVAPPWQMPDEAEELRACQRYYLRTTGSARNNGSYQLYATDSVQFPVAMRTAPAGAVGAAAIGGNVSMAVFAAYPTYPDGTCTSGRLDINGGGAGDYYSLSAEIVCSARM